MMPKKRQEITTLATLRRAAPFMALAALLASATACTAASPVNSAGEVSSLAGRPVKVAAGPAGGGEFLVRRLGRGARRHRLPPSSFAPAETGGHEQRHRYSFHCRGARYQLSGIAAASASRVSFLCINLVSPSMGAEGIEVMDSANGGGTAHFAGRRRIATNGARLRCRGTAPG